MHASILKREEDSSVLTEAVVEVLCQNYSLNASALVDEMKTFQIVYKTDEGNIDLTDLVHLGDRVVAHQHLEVTDTLMQSLKMKTN